MFKFIIEWWNGKENNETEGETEGNSSYKVKNKLEKEWVYRTSILDDLYAITDLLDNNESIKDIVSGLHIVGDNKVRFKTIGLNKHFVIEKLKLKTIDLDESNYGRYTVTKYNRHWEEPSQLDRYFDEPREENYSWVADKNEYEKIYLGTNYEYNKNVIQPITNKVKGCFTNIQYSHIFIKYEDSISTIRRVLQDSLDNDDTISEEIFEKSSVIIDKLSKTIDIKSDELEIVEELNKIAVSKSLSSILDRELEYIEKFVETK